MELSSKQRKADQNEEIIPREGLDRLPQDPAHLGVGYKSLVYQLRNSLFSRGKRLLGGHRLDCVVVEVPVEVQLLVVEPLLHELEEFPLYLELQLRPHSPGVSALGLGSEELVYQTHLFLL